IAKICIARLVLYILCATRDLLYFFFSSRRRHTRSKRDWSSDVCSSDLVEWKKQTTKYRQKQMILDLLRSHLLIQTIRISRSLKRSEERRVGKECISRWAPNE